MGDFRHPLQVVGGDRLLHQLDAQALILHGGDDPDGVLHRPALVGVHPDGDIRTHRLPDGGDAGEVGEALLPHLHLQDAVAVLYGGQGIRHHLGDSPHADGEIRFKGRAVSPQEAPKGLAQHLAPQVVEGHIHRRLGGGVPLDGARHPFNHLVQAEDIHAGDGGGDVLVDGGKDRALGVPGNNRGGRGLPVAHHAVFGGDAHHNVLHPFHGAQGGFKGPCQGDLDFPGGNAGDPHRGRHLLFSDSEMQDEQPLVANPAG